MALTLFCYLLVTISIANLDDEYMSEVCDAECLQSRQEFINEDQFEFSYDNYPVFRLPSIDLSKFTNPSNPNEKKSIIKSFDHYLATFGTLSLTNHGIPLSLMDRIFKIGKAFFDKPIEYKLQFQNSGLGTSGYDLWKSQVAASAYGIKDQPPDLHEDFCMYNHDGDIPSFDYGPSKDKTPPELYNISREYIPKIRHVLKTVHELAALSLGLDKDYFEKTYTNTSSHHLRWFNYPPLNLSKLLPKQMRVSVHKDFLGFTLFTTVGRGMQMKIGNTWIDAETKNKYDFILNTGEVYELYTNNHWKPNWHRVIPLANQKMTLSYFSGPDQDTILKPIEECVVCTKEPQKLVTRTAAQQGALRYGGADAFTDVCGEQCVEGQKFFND